MEKVNVREYANGAVRSLLQYFAFVHDLKESLNCYVDVVTTDIEDKDFLIKISKEMIVLNEQQR